MLTFVYDRLLLKRAVDAAEEGVEIAKSTRVMQEDLSEKVDAISEIVAQGAVRTEECVTQLEALADRMTSLQSVAAAAGDGTASSGPGKTGVELPFPTFVENTAGSQTIKGAVVQVAMEKSYRISGDRPQFTSST